MNKCEHDPSGKHNCTHQQYCIFNNNTTQLEQQILTLTKRINEFEHIKHCFINGEIIYHKELDEYYNIEIIYYQGTKWDTPTIKTFVDVTDGFINALNTKIKALKYDLKNLEKYKRNILHEKIGGYGS